MLDRSANLLGALGLVVADRIEMVAREVLSRAGETPAALVVIGYDTGLSNEQLRRILGLSHPGSVRLVDRLVADGLVDRREGRDRRAIALYLTEQGRQTRERLLAGRLSALRRLVEPLSGPEQHTLAALVGKMLSATAHTDLERYTVCRMCDDRVCTDCPIPADKSARA